MVSKSDHLDIAATAAQQVYDQWDNDTWRNNNNML